MYSCIHCTVVELSSAILLNKHTTFNTLNFVFFNKNRKMWSLFNMKKKQSLGHPLKIISLCLRSLMVELIESEWIESHRVKYQLYNSISPTLQLYCQLYNSKMGNLPMFLLEATCQMLINPWWGGWWSLLSDDRWPTLALSWQRRKK